ncbi:MAG TPA: hypothetical protein VM869_17415 [Enhygromyxa sp.]|nr:hypothetical protein [Enhygromyxa sp.]
MSRFKLGSTITLLSLAMSAMALTTLSGCLEHPLKPVELEKGSEVEDQLQLTVNKDVDILFIIDNSGSMGEEQANLGANFPSFIGVLEQDGVEANYRIGVTTTDNGNDWCNAGTTTPEGGKLVLSPCTTRLNDFIFADQADVQDLACNDICDLDETQLEILPSTTDQDSTPSPRPWLENIEGKKNIPETTDMAAAFACFGPQGINGCGFESQLESMYLALTRAQTNTEASYGFLRASAILAIVFVTDEVDCSYNKTYSEIFDADGNKVFWSDPTAVYPTSAVCWNAGVDCTGDPSGYETCEPVNKDVDGNSGVSDSEAVLHPMSRYIGLVEGLEQEKQEINANQEVIVALIGGVSNTGDVFYASVANTDPAFEENFGIGPGCTAPNPDPMGEDVTAVPPVRLRAMTEHFTPDNMFSICESDYSPALEAIARRIEDQIQPACYTKCVKDTDAATATVDPECTVEENPPGNGSEDVLRIEECLRDANGYVIDPATEDYSMPADGVNVCYALLTDESAATGSTADDMSDECVEGNFNLEFKIARRPGFPAEGGTSISATCSLADFPEVSCPGIGG